jgi:GxxExxY protein
MPRNVLHPELSYAIIGAAMEVHTILGAGFLENVYQRSLAHELTLRTICFEEYKKLPVQYKGLAVGDYEADFLVEGKIILEIKAVGQIHQQHVAQAMHYLRATNLDLAIVINFGEPSLSYKRVAKSRKQFA